jgi:hypothetical protein
MAVARVLKFKFPHAKLQAKRIKSFEIQMLPVEIAMLPVIVTGIIELF